MLTLALNSAWNKVSGVFDAADLMVRWMMEDALSVSEAVTRSFSGIGVRPKVIEMKEKTDEANDAERQRDWVEINKGENNAVKDENVPKSLTLKDVNLRLHLVEQNRTK